MMTNFLVSLLFLAAGVSAAPEPQDFIKSLQGLFKGDGLRGIIKNPVIQQKILESDLNPCKGKPPSTFRCTNGQSIPFSIDYKTNPCSGNARPDSCTCPNRKTFKIKDLADNVVSKYDLPSCGRGTEPSFCSCRDGSTFNPKTLTGPPCKGIGFSAFPKSCTCPNGNIITINDFIAKALPAIQDFLG